MIRQQYQTYLKVAGEWCYLYRAIDRDGNLVDVYLSETRDMAAAKAFLRSAKSVTQVEPEQVTTDGHTSYPKAIAEELGTDVDHRNPHPRFTALPRTWRRSPGSSARRRSPAGCPDRRWWPAPCARRCRRSSAWCRAGSCPSGSSAGDPLPRRA